VADGVVVTAGHLVDGQLRRLEVAGLPARVMALDPTRDLALVAIESITGPLDDTQVPIVWRDHLVGAAETSAEVTVMGPSHRVSSTVRRMLRLRVSHQRDGVVHERDAIELDLLVERGESGSAVVGADGRLVGVVVLRRPGQAVSYASALPPLRDLAAGGPLAPPPGCV